MKETCPRPELKLQGQPSPVTCVQTCLAMALGVPVDRVITKYGKGAMNKDKLWAALQECGIVSNIMVFS